MRTHGLYQTSNWLVKAAKDYGILIDVSLFLPRAKNLQPHQIKWSGCSLWRIPYFWEDDLETFEDIPIWSTSDERLNISGLKVFDFHPVRIALNTNRFGTYQHIKSIRPFELWDERFVQKHMRKGKGPRNFFMELVSETDKGKKIKELVDDME